DCSSSYFFPLHSPPPPTPPLFPYTTLFRSAPAGALQQKCQENTLSRAHLSGYDETLGGGLRGPFMVEDSSFHDLMRRVRSGDEEAAAELARIYQPEIRRIVRVRLARPTLQGHLDSAAICQSVLAAFLVRAASGQWDLQTPGQLLKLLATMARNKLRDQVRRQRAARRLAPETRVGTAALETVPDKGDSPSQTAALRELLRETRRRLSAE